jgi:Na+-translocating ferredoxin:NAD+ oxidoreductase RnfG subunit
MTLPALVLFALVSLYLLALVCAFVRACLRERTCHWRQTQAAQDVLRGEVGRE